MTYQRSTKEQDATRVDIRAGLLLRSDGEPVDTRNSGSTIHSGSGVQMFVTDARSIIHMANQALGITHHSSLLAGADVAMAGELQVTKGKIDWVSNTSGHYAPDSDALVQFLGHLRKDGVAMDFEVRAFGVPRQGAAAFLQGDPAAGGDRYDRLKTESVGDYGVAGEVLAAEGWQWDWSRGSKAVVDEEGTAVSAKLLREKLRAFHRARSEYKPREARPTVRTSP